MCADYKVGNSLRVFSEKQFSSGDEQNGLSPVYELDHTQAKEWTLSALFQNSNSDDGEATGCGARAFLAD